MTIGRNVDVLRYVVLTMKACLFFVLAYSAAVGLDSDRTIAQLAHTACKATVLMRPPVGVLLLEGHSVSEMQYRK